MYKCINADGDDDDDNEHSMTGLNLFTVLACGELRNIDPDFNRSII